MRAVWKLNPFKNSIFRKKKIESAIKNNSIKLWVKGVRVFSDFSDKTVLVYNGCKLLEILVSKDMCGYFLGSLALTKRITSDIHSKTHRNKKGRRKKKKK